MILVPIGSDQARTRFPKLTVTLIVVCSIVFFFTIYARGCTVGDLIEASEELNTLEPQLMAKYLEQNGEPNPRELLYKLSFNPIHAKVFIERFRTAMKNGEVVPADSLEYRLWSDAMQRVEAAQKHDLFYRWGYVPEHPNPFTILTSMFLHGSFWHLFWNMYFLWLVGISLEDIWGRKYYLIIYLVGGVASVLAHQFMSSTPDAPLIGASGAIAALMGAYAIRFRHAKLLFAFFKWQFWVRSWIPLGFWIGKEVMNAVSNVGELMGVASWVHVGGFAFGAGIALVLARVKAEDTFIADELKKQDQKDEETKKKKEEKKAGPPPRPPELEKGIEMRKLGNWAEAKHQLGQALLAKPDEIEAWEEMVRVDFKLNDLDSVAKDMAGLIEVHLAKKNLDLALEWYQEMVKLGPQPAAAGPWLLRIGPELQRRGDFAAAAAAYHNFASALPQHQMAAKAYFVEANLLADKLGRPAEAISLLNKVRMTYPNWMPDEVEVARNQVQKKIGKT